jgi:hypothetical protein
MRTGWRVTTKDLQRHLFENGGPRCHSGVHAYEYTIRNSKGCIAALGSGARSIKQGSDKVRRYSPLLRHLDGRPVLLFGEAVRIGLAKILVTRLLSPRLEELSVDLYLFCDCFFRDHFCFFLFAAQFAFCVADIFRLAAADILWPTFRRLPPNAAIAAVIPSSCPINLFCSFFSALRMFMRFLRADCTTERKRAVS